jgi:uncharacterized protein YbbK (DUF523 family)
MGNNCKYNGGNNRCQWIIDFVRDKSIVEICPEELGGLPTPRPPAEQVGNNVVNKEGRDVTLEFQLGAKRGYEIAAAVAEKSGDKIEGAILKAKSPSCGSCEIYDGKFTGTVVKGDGYFARLLKEQGIRVMTETDEI